MLVLTLKPGEKIYVGDNVQIELHSKQRRQVKLCLAAAPEVKIRRQSVWDAIQLSERALRRLAAAAERAAT